MKGIVWVTGAGGLIGHELVSTAKEMAPGLDVVGLTRQQLDLTDYSEVKRRFRQAAPTAIIHCAALSRSPACQDNPSLARKLNVEVTSNLAELAEEIPLVFFSTDLVFDGTRGDYEETAAANPRSVYAQTKIEAEIIVMRNPRHTVIRTSLNGGCSPTGDRGFNEQLRQAWKSGKTLSLFADEFRSPIPANITARTVWQLLSRGQPGLYHLAGGERLSRWQIGQLLAARWPQLNPKITPGKAADYPGAPRSPDTSLNCEKIQHLLSIRLPGLTEWLAARPNEAF